MRLHESARTLNRFFWHIKYKPQQIGEIAASTLQCTPGNRLFSSMPCQGYLYEIGVFVQIHLAVARMPIRFSGSHTNTKGISALFHIKAGPLSSD